MKQNCIVTITDGISPTSMPFNEFVCYRLKKRPNEKQIIIQLFEKGVDKNVKIPDEVEFYSLGMNILALNKLIRSIDKKYNIRAFHIHEGKSVILFSLATLFSKRKRAVYTVHSTYKNYPLHNKVFSFIGAILAKKVTCVSETSYKYFPSILKKIFKSNIVAVQNGVDIDRIGDAITQTKDNKLFTITYVARLVPLKRHSVLLNIIKDIQNIQLELIGIGPLENDLKRIVQQLKIEDKVNFLGLLPREEVYNHLKKTDLYVSTSSYEGLPIGVLEAMGCKAMCLVTNIEQHEEIAKKCPSLTTLPLENDLWQNKILDFMSLDHATKCNIKNANRNGVENNFSLDSMHSNYDIIYNSLRR